VSGRIGRGWRHIRPIGRWRGVAPYGACRNLARLVARLEAVPYPWGPWRCARDPLRLPPRLCSGLRQKRAGSRSALSTWGSWRCARDPSLRLKNGCARDDAHRIGSIASAPTSRKNGEKWGTRQSTRKGWGTRRIGWSYALTAGTAARFGRISPMRRICAPTPRSFSSMFSYPRSMW